MSLEDLVVYSCFNFLGFVEDYEFLYGLKVGVFEVSESLNISFED